MTAMAMAMARHSIIRRSVERPLPVGDRTQKNNGGDG